MKNRLVLLSMFMVWAGLSGLSAQERSPYRVGFHLKGLGGDFGLGLNMDIGTPDKWPTIRLGGTWHWQEIPDGLEFETASYQTFRVGVASKSFKVQEHIRAYGEGGFLAVLAGDALSYDRFGPGGYGLFGFEFFVREYGGSALFIEIGGSSAGNGMDRAPGVQAFGTGLWVGAGFRVPL